MIIGVILFIPTMITHAESPTQQRVFDEAKLFSEQDIQSFNEQIKILQEEYKTDAVIVTTQSTNGKTPEAFADDFYDSGKFGIGDTHDGMLFLIDMGNRKYQISTTGNTIASLDDNRIEKMKYRIEDDLGEGNYTAVVNTILSDTQKYVSSGPRGGYEYNKATGKVEKHKYLSPLKIGIAVLLGILGFLGLFITIRSTYKLKRSSYKYPYIDFSSVNITESQSIKTGDFTTTRHIPKPSSDNDSFGGGGSSTHFGSSGTSHGGGGGSF